MTNDPTPIVTFHPGCPLSGAVKLGIAVCTYPSCGCHTATPDDLRPKDPLSPARGILLAVVVGLIIWIPVIWFAVDAYAAVPAKGGRVPCSTLKACRKAIRWQRHDRMRLHRKLAAHTQPDVEMAYRLAQGLFHVNLRQLGYCESSNDPFNRTGSYVGITQQGDGFQSRNRDVYGLLPVTNPIANVLVAARWIAAHGSGEWQCRLDGSVKHGGAYS